uniref:Uncharacterized protein n=1 Tax=Arundo donax TaxID=35708 RepID=A0A0A8ZRE5_ARUDO
MNELLRSFRDEHHLWCLAGARTLTALSIGLVEGPG